MRYSAFISYNHRDRRTAAWLHRAIETYRVPKRLLGRESPFGLVERRLPPVFQDREELAASTDLAASVREALAEAATLVVVCSANAAGSRWVNEEIRTFTALGKRHRIQCVIAADVTPTLPEGANAMHGLFPPALFEGAATEPLAADMRPGADGREGAKLKLIAAILGVGYDELRQREHARRQRQLLIVAGASAVGFVAMSALAGFAVASRNEAVRQRDIARQKTLTAEHTVSFVKSLFEVADPSEARGDTITAREILDRGASSLDQGLVGEPTVRAELGTTLGEVYGSLGMVRKSRATLERGLALKGVEAGTRARQYLALGHAQWQAGDYEAAIGSDRRALALLGPGRAENPLLARVLSGFSDAQMRMGETARAEINARRALALDRELGAEPTQIAFDRELLGQALLYDGQLPGARREIEEALAVRLRAQGARHPQVADDLNSLGSIAYLQHDTSAAESNFRKALVGYEAVLGPEHQMVASALNNLARILLERQSFAEADRLLDRALDINLKQVGGDADDLIFEYANLGIAERGLGRLVKADAALAKAEPLARRRNHRNLAPILVERAEIACEQGRSARGLALVEEAAPIMAKAYAKDPWRGAWVLVVRGRCLVAAGRGADGRRLIRENAGAVSARWGPATLYGARLARMQLL